MIAIFYDCLIKGNGKEKASLWPQEELREAKVDTSSTDAGSEASPTCRDDPVDSAHIILTPGTATYSFSQC